MSSAVPGPDHEPTAGAVGPLFSIITIAFRDLAGLRETVESVRSQGFDDYEHVVIDGGSDDGTPEWLAADFAGDWVSERDGGRYDAMNKGVARTTGRYLWFLHAGDSFGDSGVLARMAAALQSDPVWAYGMARVVDADKRLVGTIGFAPFSLFNFAVLNRPLPHQAMAIRRSDFAAVGGYRLDSPVAADQLLMLQLVNRQEPVALADFLCDFDATGLSAGRPWLTEFGDAEHNRRHGLERPVTRYRAIDTSLAFANAAVRQLARSGRRALTRVRSIAS